MTGWRAGIAATSLVLVLWQTVIWTTGVARFILPPPVLVAQTIWENRALLTEHAFITMAEVLIGLTWVCVGHRARSITNGTRAGTPHFGFQPSCPSVCVSSYLDPLARLWPMVQDHHGPDHHLLSSDVLIL